MENKHSVKTIVKPATQTDSGLDKLEKFSRKKKWKEQKQDLLRLKIL